MIKQILLTAGNAKIVKGEKLGYLTKGLHLAPANLSGYEVCHWRSKGCTMSCLNTAGRGRMERTQDSRIAKTKLFFEQKLDFLAKVAKEITSSVKSAVKKEMTAVFRLNLTSDLEWETIENDKGQTLMNQFPNVQFYDYQLPKTWKGFEVINGDENDLRFLDKQGVVVGLIEKGMAKKDKTGFVQEGINS